MSNATLTVGAVDAFLKKATDLGCYTQQQYYNFKAIYDLMIELLKKADLDPARITVAELKAQAAELLTEHSRNSKATEGTIRTYSARIARLLADFIEHHNGDVAAWKKKIAAVPKRTSKPKSKDKQGDGEDGVPPPPPSAPGLKTYEVKVGPVVMGSVSVLGGITAEDFVWRWQKIIGLAGTIKTDLSGSKPGTTKGGNNG